MFKVHLKFYFCVVVEGHDTVMYLYPNPVDATGSMLLILKVSLMGQEHLTTVSCLKGVAFCHDLNETELNYAILSLC